MFGHWKSFSRSEDCARLTAMHIGSATHFDSAMHIGSAMHFDSATHIGCAPHFDSATHIGCAPQLGSARNLTARFGRSICAVAALLVCLLFLPGCADKQLMRDDSGVPLTGTHVEYADGGEVLERTEYVEGVKDGAFWRKLNDSVAVSGAYVAGELDESSLDTMYMRTPVLFGEEPWETLLVRGGRDVVRAARQAWRAVKQVAKDVVDEAAERAPAVASRVGGWFSAAKALAKDYLGADVVEGAEGKIAAAEERVRRAMESDEVQTAIGVAKDVSGEIADAVGDAAGKVGGAVSDAVGGVAPGDLSTAVATFAGYVPGKLDTNLAFALYAGYVRGVSVAYQDAKQTLKDVASFVPEVADYVRENTLEDAKRQAGSLVEAGVAGAVKLAEPDSLVAAMGALRSRAAEIPNYMETLKDAFIDEMETSMERAGIGNDYLEAYSFAFGAGYVSFDMAAGYVAYKLTTKLVGLGKYPRNSAEIAEKARHAPARGKVAASETLGNRSFRMPREGVNGHWKNPQTKNVWVSDMPEVNAVTRGKPVRFFGNEKTKHPDFSPWSRTSYTFKKGELVGNDLDDFDKVYEKMVQHGRGGVKTKGEAKRYLKRNGLTPHHASCTEIQLVPTALHENVPHTGGAAQIRNGICKL